MNQIISYALITIFFITLAACGSTSVLKGMKAEHNKGNYEVVIKTKIECKDSDDGCNQQHLIKGDACYRLAKSDKNPIKNYDCAIAQLDMGINLTTSWKVGSLDLQKNQTHENYNESIRERQDRSKGATANQFTKQLIKASERFLLASPGNLAAIYFNSSAKFTALRMAILTKPDDIRVCTAINKILLSLGTVSDEAMESKYSAQFSQLTNDVTGVKPGLVNCK